MPQMSPINWTIMFAIFIFMFMTAMSKIYFYKGVTYEQSTHKSSFTTVKNYWTW